MDQPQFVIRPFWDTADTLNDATGCAAAKAQSWIAAQPRLNNIQITTAISQDNDGFPYRYHCVVTVAAVLLGTELMTPEDQARADAPRNAMQEFGQRVLWKLHNDLKDW